MKTLHKNVFKQPFFWTSICSCLTLGILIALYSHAWVAPTGNPNSSAGAAINFSGGNVGIGTTSPAAKLSVDINDASANTKPYINLFNDASGYAKWQLAKTGSNDLSIVGLNSGGTSSWGTPITFQYLGNVGIGTTGPGFKLSVAQDMTMGGDVTNGTAQMVIQGATTAGKKLLLGYDTNGNGFGFIKAGNEGVAWTNLALQPNGGNVGIGTTNPGAELDVMSDGVPSVIRLETTNNASNQNAEFRFDSTGTNNLDIRTNYAVAANKITLSPGAATAMTLLGSGNVGIGTTPGQKLSVAGVIESTTGGFKFPNGTIQTTAATATVSQQCVLCCAASLEGNGCGGQWPYWGGNVRNTSATLLSFLSGCAGSLVFQACQTSQTSLCCR